MNQNSLQYLKCYVNYLHEDCSTLLNFGEFAINYVVNSSIGKSPFEINYEFKLRMDYVEAWISNRKIIHSDVEAALYRCTDGMINSLIDTE